MSLELIDTHCHLDFPVFDSNRQQVVDNACGLGVSQIIVPGVTAKDWPRLLTTCKQYGQPAALGLHPCFIDQHRTDDLQQLEVLLTSENVVAVGEIGLDFFVKGLDQERQLQFFAEQLALAKRFDLPVILHVRKAHDQVLKQLRQLKLPRAGTVHAYSGSEQQAHQYVDLGFKLGIGGTLTYERAKKLRRLVCDLPLEAFVLETDAPDIPLSAHRDQPNQPCRVREVANVFAELRGVSLELLAQQTSENARAVFFPQS